MHYTQPRPYIKDGSVFIPITKSNILQSSTKVCCSNIDFHKTFSLVCRLRWIKSQYITNMFLNVRLSFPTILCDSIPNDSGIFYQRIWDSGMMKSSSLYACIKCHTGLNQCKIKWQVLLRLPEFILPVEYWKIKCVKKMKGTSS